MARTIQKVCLFLKKIETERKKDTLTGKKTLIIYILTLQSLLILIMV